MKIAISCETTVDLTKELIEQYDLKVVPFTLNLGERSGFDGDITPDDIFKYFEDTGDLAKTSAVNEFQYEEHFQSILKDYDYVIHICLGSDFSSAYQNAVLAAETVKNVSIIDSKTLSTGIGLLCVYAATLAKEGAEPEKIIRKVNNRIPYVQASFIVPSVTYLYKGGRCSAVSRLVATFLRIKPQIVVRNGKMVPGKKYRGRKLPCTKSYVEDILNEFTFPDLSIAFLTHSGATEEMIQACYGALKNRGFEKIYITQAGGTISCHCGPRSIGVLYINDGKH